MRYYGFIERLHKVSISPTIGIKFRFVIHINKYDKFKYEVEELNLMARKTSFFVREGWKIF
jgi:hypothetical protein